MWQNVVSERGGQSSYVKTQQHMLGPAYRARVDSKGVASGALLAE